MPVLMLPKGLTSYPFEPERLMFDLQNDPAIRRQYEELSDGNWEQSEPNAQSLPWQIFEPPGFSTQYPESFQKLSIQAKQLAGQIKKELEALTGLREQKTALSGKSLAPREFFCCQAEDKVQAVPFLLSQNIDLANIRIQKHTPHIDRNQPAGGGSTEPV